MFWINYESFMNFQLNNNKFLGMIVLKAPIKMFDGSVRSQVRVSTKII